MKKLVEHVALRFNDRHGTKLAFRGHLEEIPLAVDEQRFCPLDRRECRQRFDLPDDAFVMLWVGRLSAIDKADLLPLVMVTQDLIRANPDRSIVLCIAGTQHPEELLGDHESVSLASP